MTIARPCRSQNFARSGTRAIVPSSFMTSQITADGSRPAIRARSTEASVCPARFRTPPACARSGNMWPGRARSAGRVAGSIAVRTVAARSAAEMPVVVRPARLDRDRERRPEVGRVLLDHRRQLELVAALLGQREADQAAALARHEVDRLGRDLLGREDEVALVLPVLVVHDDDEPPGAQLLDRLARSSRTAFREFVHPAHFRTPFTGLHVATGEPGRLAGPGGRVQGSCHPLASLCHPERPVLRSAPSP